MSSPAGTFRQRGATLRAGEGLASAPCQAPADPGHPHHLALSAVQASLEASFGGAVT